MPDFNWISVVVATTAAFVLSAGYYIVLGDQLATVSAAATDTAAPPPWTIAVEGGRSLVVTVVVAGLAIETGTDEWWGGALLGVALFVGFPLILWVGAIVHERTPAKLALIHAGDWLAKLVVVGVIVSAWQ